MEDVLLLRCGAAQRGRAGRRRGPPAVQVVRRRRVPGRQPDPVGAARPVARRARRPLRRRRPRADDLLLRRRPGRLPRRLPAKFPGATTRRAGPQLPLDAAGDRRRPTRLAAPAPRRRRSSCARSGRPEPEVSWHEATDEVAEADAVRRAGESAARRPARRCARWRCCSGSTPSPRPSRRRWPARGIPYVVRGAARFFERPEVRQAVTLLRGEVRPAATDSRPEGRGPGRPSHGGARRHGLVGRGARGPRPGPRPLGVAAGAGLAGDRLRRGRDADASLAEFVAELDRRAAEQHAPVAEGVTLATLHAAKGLEWDAVVPLRHARGDDADHLRRHPGRGRGGAAAALRRHDPGPARPVASRGRWPATRAAQARRKPSRFLDGLRPESATDRAAPSERPTRPTYGQAGRGVPSVPAAAGRLAASASAAAAPTARCPTTRSCSRGCARGARSRPTPRACRRTSSSPTRPSRRSPRSGPPIAPGCGRSTASGRPSWTSTATSCSGSSPDARKAPPHRQLSACLERISR